VTKSGIAVFMPQPYTPAPAQRGVAGVLVLAAEATGFAVFNSVHYRSAISG
jgi:hypothetical protein